MEGKPASLGRLESRLRPQPEHANNNGKMHGGHILYYLDTHCGMSAARFSGAKVVTVSVDRMDFIRPVDLGYNMVIKTSVNMAHQHSMEVGARLELEHPRTLEVIHAGTAYFTFVALDENDRPKTVPHLIPETDEDKRRMADAVRRSYMRRMERAQAKGKAFAFSIELLPEQFFLCRFPLGVMPPVPPAGSFVACAATDTETTLVFPQSPATDAIVDTIQNVDGMRVEKGWRAFAVRETLDLSVSGVAAALSAVLAAESISVQYISTFSSGYLMVRGNDADEAAEALRFAGHTVFPL